MSPTAPTALRATATFDPCPTCGCEVTDVRGETPYNPDIDPVSKVKVAAPTGFMQWFAVPCGHPVLSSVDVTAGHVHLERHE